MPKFSMTRRKFINQWLRHFAGDVPKSQLEKHVKDQFIWNVFSWELISSDDLLVREEARRAYDRVCKENCIFCDLYGGVTDQRSDQYDTAEKIDENFIEFYVMSKDHSWTYIKTHETEQCGPYFYRISG